MTAAPRDRWGAQRHTEILVEWQGRDREIQAERDGEARTQGGKQDNRQQGDRETKAESEMQALKFRQRERQAERLHDKEDQNWGQTDPCLGRQTDRPLSAFFRLARSPHLLGKPLTAAAATIKPDSFWPLPPSPLLSLPQSLLQSPPLFKMSFCSCSPDSCSILEPALRPGGWVLEGCPPGQQEGVGMGLQGRGLPGAWGPTHLSSTTSPGVPTPWPPLGPSRARPEPCPAPNTGPGCPALRALSGLRVLVTPRPTLPGS